MLVWTFSLRWFEDVWGSWHLHPSRFPKTHLQQSSPSRDMLHMDVSVGRANPDDLSLPGIHFNLRAALCPAATLRCFFDPSEGTFYHSLRHVRKDLLSKWFETHEGSNWSIPIIIPNCFLDLIRLSFVSPGFPLLLDCWHARHLQKPLSHDASLRKKHRASLLEFPAKTEPWGSKIGASLLGTAKMPSLRCRKTQAVPKCIEGACAKHHNAPNFFLAKHRWCHKAKTWSGSR